MTLPVSATGEVERPPPKDELLPPVTDRRTGVSNLLALITGKEYRLESVAGVMALDLMLVGSRHQKPWSDFRLAGGIPGRTCRRLHALLLGCRITRAPWRLNPRRPRRLAPECVLRAVFRLSLPIGAAHRIGTAIPDSPSLYAAAKPLQSDLAPSGAEKIAEDLREPDNFTA